MTCRGRPYSPDPLPPRFKSNFVNPATAIQIPARKPTSKQRGIEPRRGRDIDMPNNDMNQATVLIAGGRPHRPHRCARAAAFWHSRQDCR